MNIFGMDGKLYKFLDKFWHMVWIGVLWIVCSLPIITIGASSAAAYYAMVKSVRKSEDKPDTLEQQHKITHFHIIRDVISRNST